MIYTIDTDLLPEGITASQYFLLLSLVEEPNTIEVATELYEKKLLTPLYDDKTRVLRGFALTDEGRDNVVNTLENSHNKGARDYTSLAEELKKVFPQGKKPGTTRYWTEGVSLINKRLKAFEKKYGKFPDSAILDAAKRFVDSYQGNYQFMPVLRYFIFKEVVGKAGDLESKSDLLTYLENSGETDERQDWTAELR